MKAQAFRQLCGPAIGKSADENSAGTDEVVEFNAARQADANPGSVLDQQTVQAQSG
jgi:hypothetical protein